MNKPATKKQARPSTVAEYVAAAPSEAQAHLKRLRAILRAAAPNATETLKWGNPFFVEPRFVYAYSAHKAHLSFAPGKATLAAFKSELATHTTTAHFLKIRYQEPLPEDLLKRMAAHCVASVSARQDEGFW
jgi:uncharacterized protein YdhG (YjbR/CyaY superfamily)